MSEQVILVDNNDNEIGTMAKLEAHQKGILHRAFSVFIFNSKGEMLLQQRALNKYHSGGLWSNACCSHPFPGENIIDAAKRRLMEEMGIKADLQHIYSFIYNVQLDNELSEHEFDHVLIGICNEIPFVNQDEILNWKYVTIPKLLEDIQIKPTTYTSWFRICINNVLDKMRLETNDQCT
ncbi:MAG TPA: isopentenyl-diphosphate Delta-isomerase [Bacteroidia bacterium]|nr:isopentenyl-diphosphate Delta-isomerase [Bacteroidia bacterium]